MFYDFSRAAATIYIVTEHHDERSLSVDGGILPYAFLHLEELIVAAVHIADRVNGAKLIRF